MAIPNRGLPSYSFAMFLAFASFGSYIWSTDPLKTARPESKNPPAISSTSLNSISARLWQDPFRVIYARNKDNALPDIQSLGEGSQLRKSVADYFETEKEKTAPEELLVLGVMVSTEAISDAEERRRRSRYALVSALSNADYVPEDAEHIQVGKVSGVEDEHDRMILPYEWYKHESLISSSGKKVLLLWLDSSHYAKTPYKHFKKLIETLSVDEQARKKMRLAILGPSGSGGLSALIKNAVPVDNEPYSPAVGKLYGLGIAGLHILSPSATVANDLLYDTENACSENNVQAKTNETCLDNRFSLDKCTEGEFCLTFHRTIYSDDKLMHELTTELEFRGIDDAHSHVVLLSELDTTFGRALPLSFIENFCKNKHIDKDSGEELSADDIAQNIKTCEDHVHNFNYLRGIDGVAPGSIADIGLSSSKSSKSKNDNEPENKSYDIRRPIGAGQFDYLRRIADEMVQMDKDFRKFNGKGIRAIGVLGSDVYDKLLILHALRSRLMGVTFFTTDLDAQLLHPSEFNWARNLVIASSFDLKLTSRLQKNTPPFRDSYQTSMFYSAGLALKLDENYLHTKKPINFHPVKGQSKNDFFNVMVNLPTQLGPLIFEVGRNGAVPLRTSDEIRSHNHNHNTNNNDGGGGHSHKLDECESTSLCALHPTQDSKYKEQSLVLVVAILLLVLLALWQLNAKASYQIMWFGSGVFALVAVVAIGVSFSSVHEEPFIMLAGVSVWPTEIINSMAFILSLYFICISKRALEKNYLTIGHDYFLFSKIDYSPNSHGVPLSMATISFHLPCVKNDWIYLVAIMLVVSALMVAILPLTIAYEYINYILMLWVLIFVVWFSLIYRCVPVASINQWIKNSQKRKEHSDKTKLSMPIQLYWKNYGEYGTQRNRFLRACTVVLIFQAFLSIIFTLFGLEAPPLRGTVTQWVDAIVTVLSLLGMLFVLFYMVDATRLCIAWIKGLTENQYDWGDTKVDEYRVKLNVPRHYAIDWLKLRIISERTAEVGKLIFYPFIIIILILFSRINYFDDWGFPQSLAIITSCLIAIALYSAIKLRQEAEAVRGEFLEKLYMDKLTVGGNVSRDDKPTLTQIDELIDNVSRLRKGAFQPFLEQPLVKATLLLLGGVGISASQFTYLL